MARSIESVEAALLIPTCALMTFAAETLDGTPGYPQTLVSLGELAGKASVILGLGALAYNAIRRSPN